MDIHTIFPDSRKDWFKVRATLYPGIDANCDHLYMPPQVFRKDGSSYGFGEAFHVMCVE